MKKRLLFITFIVALCTVNAQERPSYMYKNCDGITADVQGFLYCWKDATLEKYEVVNHQPNTPTLLYHYSNPSLGAITQVDASIPTKPLVFYQEAGAIVMLDNKLTAINTLDLFNKGFNSISLVAAVGPSRIALYDESNLELHLVDYELNTIRTTKCNFEEGFNPQIILTNLDKSIMLIDSALGVFIFDQFGSFEKRIRLVGIESGDLINDKLIYLKNNKVYLYNFATQENDYWTEGTNAKCIKKGGSYYYQLLNTGETQTSLVVAG